MLVVRLASSFLVVPVLASAWSDPGRAVPSQTAGSTSAQRTRDARGPAGAAGRAADRAAKPSRP